MRIVLVMATAGVTALTSSALAATITLTTATGGGADTFLRRNSSANFGNDASVAIKKQGEGENSDNDRIGLLKFDTSALAGAGPVGNVTLHLQSGGTTSTGNSGNSFLAGHVVHLYGIPDRHAQEDFTPSTLTFADFAFTTGSGGHHARPAVDVAVNGIDDTLAILVGRFAFPSTPRYQPSGTPLSFSTVPLTQFLAADTNGVASFILASMTDGPGQVPVVHSAQSATPGATIPTLVVQAGAIDPAVPEPGHLAVVALGLMTLSRRRTRAAGA